MKNLGQLEQEAKQARDDMREVMCEEFGIGATLSDRILSLMIRAVQSNIAHNDAKQEVSDDGSGESLPEVSKEERDRDGWIEWNGGECPIGESVLVETRTKNGFITQPWEASELRWENAGRNKMLNPDYDIIAYRIVKGE